MVIELEFGEGTKTGETGISPVFVFGLLTGVVLWQDLYHRIVIGWYVSNPVE